MIEFVDLDKWFRMTDGSRHYVYRDLSLRLPAKTSIGVVGRNGAGKSTLVRMLAGTEDPSSGKIICQGRISPPIGLSGGLSKWLTGRENAKFVCRVFGDPADVMRERLEFICDFAQVGKHFDQPVRTYSSGMRARVGFAISLAFEYDYYLIDEVTAVGDERFRRRAAAILASKRERAGVLQVSHNVELLREQCQAGLYVRDGGAVYFADIDEAIDAYRKESA